MFLSNGMKKIFSRKKKIQKWPQDSDKILACRQIFVTSLFTLYVDMLPSATYQQAQLRLYFVINLFIRSQ